MANLPVPTFSEAFEFATSLVTAGQPPPLAVPWICEHFIDPITGKLVRLEPFQRRILRLATQMTPEGYSRWNTVVWSQIKKSGKTAIAGAVGSWVANCIETPNEVSCVANDQEQSAGRIFASMIPTLEATGWIVPKSPKGTPFAYHTKLGGMCKAITTNYKGEAGGNQGLSLWSELWAYSGERLNRLWEEMTPPPTRKFRMRWVETYAGYITESLLLWGLYTMVFKDETERELQYGVTKVWEDLPVYVVEEANMLLFWDHVPRMPWQTPAYYAEQRTSTMRNSAYTRLHENRWIQSAEQFITEEMWRNSLRRQGPTPVPATYAADAGVNNDCTALVGCVREGQTVVTTDAQVWVPEGGQEIDQDQVMRTILELYEKGWLVPPLYYDPYQLVKLAQDLRRKGLRCEEFPQGQERIKADTFLYKLYNEGRMQNWPHPALKQHVMAAHAEPQGKDKEDKRIVKPGEEKSSESPVRIVKPGTGDEHVRKVDLAVAQSMAAYRAYHRPQGGWGMSGV